MSKKKIMVLVTSALVTVGIAGTTLALFTSKDDVTNQFQTIKDTDNNGDAGIDIWEKFDKDKAGKVLPSVSVDKIVQVQNTAEYSQLLRVKIIPSLQIVKTDEKGNAIKDVNGELQYVDASWQDALELTIDSVDINDVKDNDGKIDLDQVNAKGIFWVKNTDGSYYYAGRLSAGKFTTELLKSVKFKDGLTNEYKNAKFDVRIDADSTQSNVEYNDEWKILNNYVSKDSYDASDSGVNAIDSAVNGSIATGDEHIGNNLN